MEQVRDQAAAGTARTPVALWIARRAAQVLLASGTLQEKTAKTQRSPRETLRDLCGLAIFSCQMPDTNDSCGACARTQTGRTVPDFPETPAASFHLPGGGRIAAECRPARHDGVEGWGSHLVKCGNSNSVNLRVPMAKLGHRELLRIGQSERLWRRYASRNTGPNQPRTASLASIAFSASPSERGNARGASCPPATPACAAAHRHRRTAPRPAPGTDWPHHRTRGTRN